MSCICSGGYCAFSKGSGTPYHVPGCHSVETMQSLYLEGRDSGMILDVTMTQLQYAVSLQSLVLKGKIDLKGKRLSLPSSLTELHLNSEHIDSESLAGLSTLVALKKLHLEKCKVPNLALKHLNSLQIQDLTFTDCTDLGNVGLKQLTLTSITSLTISNCRLIGDEGILHVFLLSNVVNLSLNGCDKITSKCFDALNACALKKLSLSRCNNVDNCLKTLKSGALEVLSLSSCAKIADLCLSSLDRFAFSLRSIAIKDCPQVTSRSWIYLSSVHLDFFSLGGRLVQKQNIEEVLTHLSFTELSEWIGVGRLYDRLYRLIAAYAAEPESLASSTSSNEGI